jgi:hypothetical protein
MLHVPRASARKAKSHKGFMDPTTSGMVIAKWTSPDCPYYRLETQMGTLQQ